MLRHHFTRIVGTSPSAYLAHLQPPAGARGRARWETATVATWTNWAGTVSAEVTVAAPARRGASCSAWSPRAPRRAARVKPIGAGHSFTAIGATDGVQLRLDRLHRHRARRPRDRAGHRARPARRLHELNEALWQLGLALTNLGDIDVQTVAGAISTGTHGTGARLGGLATQVRALRAGAGRRGAAALLGRRGAGPVRRGAGRPRRARRHRRPSPCSASPRSRCAAAEAPATLDEVLAELDEHVDGNDHFEFYWFPHTRRVLTKRNNRVLPGTALRAAGPAARTGSTTSSCPTPSSTRQPGHDPAPGADPAGQRGRRPGARARATTSTARYRVFASPRTGALPRDGVRRAARRRARRAAPRSRRGSRAAASRSASRSRCASPPPTTSGCRPPTAATPATSPCTSTTGATTSAYFRAVEAIAQRRRRPPALGQAALPRRRVAAPRPIRASPTSSPLRDRSTRTACSATRYLETVLG